MESVSEQPVKTVVLVDDDDLVRRLVSRVLEREGYRVLGATSGEEGLELVERTREADLLLTDVTLPGEVDGLELGRRALQDRSDLKLVCMSGYGKEDSAADLARIASTAVFLSKPFSTVDLVETVNRLLDGATATNDEAQAPESASGS
jgi:two-component system cell cycle sensor histidine kinase/response regulator CckA